MMLLNVGVISTTVFLCNGQLADLFFPKLATNSRRVLNDITKTPLVIQSSQFTGDFAAKTVDSFTVIPTEVARFLGSNYQRLPSIESDRNLRDSIDKYLLDFSTGSTNEDARLDIRQLIRKHGYRVEEHRVMTEDGYILTMFRIPSNGSVVFVQHGLLSSADDFIVGGVGVGLAYLLADDGYDVWLGNARGNKHSRRHVQIPPSAPVFWDFSWHEIGVRDLPAMIDYTLRHTGAAKLKYVGHSQGTTAFFVMTSERPEYNDKISVMVALSPVAFMSHIVSPVVRLLSPGAPLVHATLKAVGMYEFLPDDNIKKAFAFIVCGLGAFSDLVCGNILFLVAGVGYAQLNFTNLPVILGHIPSGIATKQLVHYAQEVVSGRFRQFDYGARVNFQRYRSEQPPDYKLESIKVPICLFYSDGDWLAHPVDVATLNQRLSSVVDVYRVPISQFNHLDFLWAKDYKTLIYHRLRNIFSYF